MEAHPTSFEHLFWKVQTSHLDKISSFFLFLNVLVADKVDYLQFLIFNIMEKAWQPTKRGPWPTRGPPAHRMRNTIIYNFTNVLHAAFTQADPKSAKRH